MYKLFTKKIFFSLGMIGTLFYLVHTILGNILWKEYNPITTDISSLTAIGAPNANLLSIFSSIYGICILLFIIAMLFKSFKEYHILVRIGYLLLFIMGLTSFVGYNLFPLEGDKTVMTFNNMMHIVVTVIVVFTSIGSGFFLAFGYMKQEKLLKLGKIILIFSILITCFGLLNPINMASGWNILGLTERLVIYTLHSLIFYLSFIYTSKTSLN